ncbi:MAG TPA: mannose-6-phosphate isomerase, class I [Candidatus Stackebrandtia excrementipullorum]|nr:mannose-6-phosphate isomerase, class I [Candidatus Stackebrandtia excrementipullorum]
MVSVELLHGAIRPYAWGSHSAIAALQGRPEPTQRPEAELWLGDHPRDPAMLEDGRSLADLISADPVMTLGTDSLERYGQRLPFLLKVLAAQEPLSLQAHPDSEQAADGFARQTREGVPLDAPQRSYVDVHHKPELLCAVTRFEALCGFRPPSEAADAIERLKVDELSCLVAVLRQDDEAQALREAMTTLLTLPVDHRTRLVAAAVASATDLAEAGPDAADYAMVVRLGTRYPHDSGALVALLLNHLFLEPGDAIYMPAGNLHAYLGGVGIEVMAASDNVLRGGLTDKHVDVPELLRVLRFEVMAEPRFPAVEPTPGLRQWSVPVPEFALWRLRLDDEVTEQELHSEGAMIILCWSGDLRIDDGERSLTLRPGQGAFIPAGVGKVFTTGTGESYCAGVGAGR